jgi:hypothetical protein
MGGGRWKMGKEKGKGSTSRDEGRAKRELAERGSWRQEQAQKGVCGVGEGGGGGEGVGEGVGEGGGEGVGEGVGEGGGEGEGEGGGWGISNRKETMNKQVTPSLLIRLHCIPYCPF